MSIKRVYRARPEPGWYYIYDLYIAGRRVRTPRGEAFPTKDECRDAVSAIRTDYRRGKYQFPADRSNVKVAELREAWTAEQAIRGRVAKHIERITRILKNFEKALSPGIVVADIDSDHIKKYFLKRVGDGLKTQTAATEVVVVMTALNNAPSLFRSLKDWRPPRKPKEIVAWAVGRERMINREEEGLIIEALMRSRNPLHKQDARIFWFAIRTGMREGEILGLLKTSVCFERAIKMEYGWIEVRRSHGSERTKTGRKRIIPLSQGVAEMLKLQMPASVGVYVFSGKQGRRRAPNTLVHSLEDACVQAGIPYGREKPGAIVFHDTRHTAATRMLQAGIDLKTVGEILGHSDEYMTMRYAHATAASRQAAVAALDDGGFQVRFETTTPDNQSQSDTSRPRLLRPKMKMQK